MNVKATMQWSTPFSFGVLLAFAIVALAACALLRWASGRPIAPARRPALLVLRLAILAILGLIIINPIWVNETPGIVDRPKLFYLLDTSQSMAIGNDRTRWAHVVQTIREADGSRDSRTGAQINMFRFGSGLAAVNGDFWREQGATSASGTSPGAVRDASAGFREGEPPGELRHHPAGTEPRPPGITQGHLAAEAPRPGEAPPGPTDSDTLLGASLEDLAQRFGQTPPQAVVVFSDGRARDSDKAGTIARAYGRMKVPLHVFPVGDENVGGDVAIVSVVAPHQVRRFSTMAARVFVRSFGYKGQRTELKIVAVGPQGEPDAVLSRIPIVLDDGLADYSLAFDSGDHDRRIEARIDVQAGEVSTANNAFGADLAIDHTKIRVLYLEGEPDRYVALADRSVVDRQSRGDYSSLQAALMEDPDIECTAVMTGRAAGEFSTSVRSNERRSWLPESRSTLFAYDAIILSNVARDTLSEPQLAWFEDWISERAGGLCMVGGPDSFAGGQWNQTSVAKMLPVELVAVGPDWDESLTTLHAAAEGAIHPIWHIFSDDARNHTILKTLPNFQGRNRIGPVKPGADVLARTSRPGVAGELMPALAVQPYGRGRTMAMTTAITRRWASEFAQSWGGAGAPYYKKFWRNVVYWLTENSSIGRRRLVAGTDKRLYRPGEPIILRARTFGENAALTLDYRVAATVEPRSASDVTSDNSPLHRPTGGPKPAHEKGPLLPWSEEFNLARDTAEKSFAATLSIAQAKSLPAGASLTQGLRFELTAYENNTQVDSTTLEVQILDDPTEQQNPLPDHDLLRRIAKESGGTVLSGAKELSALIDRLPRTTGPAQVKKTPAWSVWPLLSLLIGLLTVEWICRRCMGLA